MTRWISVFSLMMLISACASLGKQDVTADWDEQTLYARATERLKAQDYARAVDYYKKLNIRYPYGEYSQQAQLNIAYAYYRLEEPFEALAAADEFIRFYPRHPEVAYAYYLRGLINFSPALSIFDRLLPMDDSQRDPGTALDAYQDFARVVEQYPDSVYAPDARQRMLYLRNNLARNEIHIARFYLKRGAFLAAANRANYVVQHYQRTPAVKAALEIMITAYTRLGLDQLATDARKVLALNENNGSLIDEAQFQKDSTWLEKAWDYLELDKN
ncbi:MAG: outer membrane protein assembly factor BamD [Pseudomonadota bacterium]